MHIQKAINPSFPFMECLTNAFSKRALGLLSGGLTLAALTCAGSAVFQNTTLTMSGIMLGLLMALYAMNATGYLLMRETQSRFVAMAEPVETLQALRWSIAHGHSLLGVLLLLIIGLAASATIGGLFLMLCKIPGIGTALYACIFPILALFFAALILCAISIVLLAAPAIWCGNGALFSVKHLLRMFSRHWPIALGQLALLFLLVMGVGAVVAILLALGSSIVSQLSGRVLFSSMELLLDQDKGHELAESIGSGIAWGLGLLLPLLVMISGLCQISVNTLGWFNAALHQSEIDQHTGQSENQ